MITIRCNICNLIDVREISFIVDSLNVRIIAKCFLQCSICIVHRIDKVCLSETGFLYIRDELGIHLTQEVIRCNHCSSCTITNSGNAVKADLLQHVENAVIRRIGKLELAQARPTILTRIGKTSTVINNSSGAIRTQSLYDHVCCNL